MGLALEEPKQDDETHEEQGVKFLIPTEIQRWLSSGVDLHVDYNQHWSSFSVRLGSSYGNC